MVEGKAVERQVELRAACSPDSATHLLVREPNFCRYTMVLYHPQLCDVQKLKPVPVLSSSSSSAGDGKGGKVTGGLPGAAAGSKAAAAAAAAVGGQAAAEAAKHGAVSTGEGVKTPPVKTPPAAAAAAAEGSKLTSQPAITGTAGGTGAGKQTRDGSSSSSRGRRRSEDTGSEGKPKLSTS